MPSIETVRDWPGRTLVDRDGARVGAIQEIYLDARTEQPEWALVNTGLFGMKSSFVPILSAEPDGEEVRVPYDKAQIKDAPAIEPDGELSEYEESELYKHYGFDYDEDEGELATSSPSPSPSPPSPPEPAGVIPDATWPATGTTLREPSLEPVDAAVGEPAAAAPAVPDEAVGGPVPAAPAQPAAGAPGGPARRLRRYMVTEYVIRSDVDGSEQVVVDRQPVPDDEPPPG